jgi:hypothetical protein
MEIMAEERRIVVASDSGIAIRSFNDIADAIEACIGRVGLILTEDNLTPAFFDLSSGLAGELFQKLVNYKVRTAIVVPHPEAHGERFLRSRDEADAWLRA